MSNKKTKECMALQEGSKIWLITRTVSNLTDTPPPPNLQYYDVQTLEYRYISKLIITPSKF